MPSEIEIEIGRAVPTIEMQIGLALAVQNPDKSYVHEQAIASTTWMIPHPLQKYPTVTIVDSAGTLILSSITYISNSLIRVSHSAAFSGRAFLN